MISAGEAHSVIQACIIPDGLFKIVSVDINNANGLFLAEDIFATRNQPPFNRSMMDGISISSSSRKQVFKKESIARAGSPKLTLNDLDSCIEVMTGAPVPEGCDCVVPYEEVRDCGDFFELVNSDQALVPGKFIHGEGSDYRVGDLLLKRGAIVNSTIISLLTSLGLSSVKVLELSSVAVISTGDELVEPGMSLLDHQIFRSNPYAIKSEIVGFFPKSKVDLFHINDDEKEVEKALFDILSTYKLIIISGGVSKGKYDYIPNSLKKLGAKEHFHKVKQRPGKPLWFGTGAQGQIIFGLPGNPVSSLINTRRHIIPLLESYLREEHRSSYPIKAAVDMEIGSSFTHFIPVSLSILEGMVFGTPSTGNNSGDFSKLVFSKGFIEVPGDQRKIIKNKTYEFFPWGSIEQRL